MTPETQRYRDLVERYFLVINRYVFKSIEGIRTDEAGETFVIIEGSECPENRLSDNECQTLDLARRLACHECSRSCEPLVLHDPTARLYAERARGLFETIHEIRHRCRVTVEFGDLLERAASDAVETRSGCNGGSYQSS